ncbi:MAG: GntR family transcriptional regulator [bacterium]|nr:GntR family transcriptional regulator [bacterium]
MKLNPDQLLRPAQYVEKFLVTAILDGTYSTGAFLPSERLLAEQMGVTRPTLRETLRRLDVEGWITIHHGKPTIVNDYWQEGGLSLLSTLARYADYLPNGIITHLLEVRLAMLPPVARQAATFNPKSMLEFLEEAGSITENTRKYSDYDWALQLLMARNSQNPVVSLILNDFSSIFTSIGLTYFSDKMARQASRAYYSELARAIHNSPGAVEQVVKRAMQESISIWQEVRSRSGESRRIN